MNIHDTVCGVFRVQAAISRNIGEKWTKKPARFAITVWLLIYSVWSGIRGIRMQTIGDVVTHNGHRWFISNWAGHAYVSLKGITTDDYKERVSQREFTVITNVESIWHRYTFYRDFYRGYWLDIDVSKRLYPEMYTRAGR